MSVRTITNRRRRGSRGPRYGCFVKEQPEGCQRRTQTSLELSNQSGLQAFRARSYGSRPVPPGTTLPRVREHDLLHKMGIFAAHGWERLRAQYKLVVGCGRNAPDFSLYDCLSCGASPCVWYIRAMVCFGRCPILLPEQYRRMNQPPREAKEVISAADKGRCESLLPFRSTRIITSLHLPSASTSYDVVLHELTMKVMCSVFNLHAVGPFNAELHTGTPIGHEYS